MDANQASEEPFEFNITNVQRLKEKYSKEVKNDANNPIRVCMKLIFEAAVEKDPSKRLDLAYHLSTFLIKPNGVINLFLALIDFDTSSQKVTTHNQRFIAVANIITCLPKLCLPYTEFCDNISKQLKSFLVSDNTKYASLAGIIIKSLLESPHAEGKDVTGIVLGPIFRAFSSHESKSMKISEAVLAIHNLVQNHLSSNLLVVIFPNLFNALLALYETPSRLKAYIKTSLVSILNDLKPGPACCLIEETLFYNQDKHKIYEQYAEDDEISLRIVDGSKSSQIQINFPDMKKVVIELLENCNNELLIMEFFFYFQAKMWTTNDDDCRQKSASLVEPLLSQTIQEESSKLDILSSIANNSGRALELISRTLLNYVEKLRSHHDKDTQKVIDPSINSCINILEVIYVSIKDKDQEYIMQKKILPTLREIRLLFPRAGNDQTKPLDSLIEKMDSDSEKARLNGHIVNDIQEREYDIAMNDLNNKLVPVRVHALVHLKQMIMTNDQYVISKIPQLYDIVESSLADQEPYVFLASINLMAEMSIRRTKEILPRLIELYSKIGLDVQQRINVGEVLVRLTKQMNKTTPYYAQEIMNTLFNGTTDHEELVRMSSLSSIGEICRYLGDSLGKYIVDILSCIERVINTDVIQVKCAAVDLLRSALMGLDKLTVESIQIELKSIYSLLKRLKYKTLDDKLCLQVDLALEELGRLAKEMLGIDKDREQGGKEDDLCKNIKVLSMLER